MNLCSFYGTGLIRPLDRAPRGASGGVFHRPLFAIPSGTMKQHFEATQWVPFPVELVFAFFANPQNLPHMMPPELDARVEDLRIQPPPPRPVAVDPGRRFKSLAAGTGTEILVSFYPVRWFPRRVSWTARIVEFSWNSHFIDEQVSGPFQSFRHRHGIHAERHEGNEGTRITDAVEFVLPGILGLMSGRIRKQLEQSFAFRHQRLPEILEVALRQAGQKSRE